jgi:AraC family transcriptional regulator, regulatory protein of adaptative response / methylated-DNA-[protein]-cysteine methyltransferase
MLPKDPEALKILPKVISHMKQIPSVPRPSAIHDMHSRAAYPRWAKTVGDGETQIADHTKEAWDAILRRDRLYDGKFVYGALTTGIYCRPSCPARHPHAHNTILFPTVADAEVAGFVACSRCCPGFNSLTVAEHCIQATLAYIEDRFDQRITLAALSKFTGFSPNHLQQMFQRVIGLTPKAFCDARRRAHFKLRLRAGDSIPQAGYAVGYGSSRAIYENAKKTLGMTPAIFRRGGDGMIIRYTVLDSELARILVATTESGICSVLLGEEKSLIQELTKEFPKAVLIHDEKPSVEISMAIASCQKEDPLLSKLPFPMRRQVFVSKAFMALLHRLWA